MKTAPGIAAAVVVVQAMLLAGCGALDRDAPDVKRHLLEAERKDEAPPASAGHLEVRTFHVAKQFGTSEFVYRTKEGAYQSDFYEQWFIPPGSMFAEACRRWLGRAGLFATVQAGGGRIRPTHVLEADVLDLYADKSDGAAQAVLRLKVVLIAGVEDVVFAREYAEREPVDGPTSAALVASWQAALARILGRVEADVRTHVQPSRRS